MPRPPHRDSDHRAGKNRWHWLLLLPVLLPLWTPLFNRLEPSIFGFPFFYWSQLALVFFAMAVIGLVHLLTKKAR